MRYIFIFLAITIIIVFTNGCRLFSDKTATGSEPVYSVAFEQNGEIQEIKDHAVTLDKAPFDMIFTFSEPMNVLFNTSFEETSYRLAREGKPTDSIPGFTHHGMAEHKFNPNKNLLIRNNSTSAWY